MSGDDLLGPALNDILRVINPLREDWEVRFRVIEEIKEVVQSVESFRGATIEPFGSFVSNLFTRWGDLDISVELTNDSCISSAGKKVKQNLLEELHRALRQKGGFRRLQFIANARVPILKFEHNQHRISCDISIDNLAGQIKSKILFWINQIDGRFRDMILLVKEWAKTHNINNPKSGTLNSYSLSLLVVFHFQTCEPAIFPPLSDIYPQNVVQDLRGVRADAERHIAEVCAANIARVKSSRAINHSSLAELFITFLAKFSDINAKATQLGICPFTGRWEDLKTNMSWLPKNCALLIEDPFEQPANSARAVSSKQLSRINEVFETSYHRLMLDKYNQSLILPTLARPHTINIMTGVTYNGYNNGAHNTRPGFHRAMQPPSQVHQQRVQNTRPSNSQPQMQHQYQNTNYPTQFQNQIPNTRPSYRNVQLNDQNTNSPARAQVRRPQPRPSTTHPSPQHHGQNTNQGSYPPYQPAQRPLQHNQQIWRPRFEK